MTGKTEVKVIIREMAEKIIREYRPRKIILFGSYAYGEPGEDSDIDLLIIKDTDQRPMERWMELKKLLRDYSRRLPVTPLVYTEKEIEERAAIKDFFLQEIMERGEVLYG